MSTVEINVKEAVKLAFAYVHDLFQAEQLPMSSLRKLSTTTRWLHGW